MDDLRGAAEPLQGLEPQSRRAVCALGLPESLEHQLQEGSFDPLFPGWRGDTSSRAPDLQAPCGDLVEHHVDKPRLDLDGAAHETVVSLNGTEDRHASRLPIEPVELEAVREQVRKAPLEAVEERERVIANADQNVHAHPATADDLGQLVRERMIRLVDEVLLELVEDHVEVGVLRSVREGVTECGNHVADPGIDDAHVHIGLLAETVGDAGTQNRALADAGCAVEHRQTRRLKIDRDRLGLASATEEQERVEVRVVECGEALVGRRWCSVADHACVSDRSRPAYRASDAT